jgi:hypothetical protein
MCYYMPDELTALWVGLWRCRPPMPIHGYGYGHMAAKHQARIHRSLAWHISRMPYSYSWRTSPIGVLPGPIQFSRRDSERATRWDDAWGRLEGVLVFASAAHVRPWPYHHRRRALAIRLISQPKWPNSHLGLDLAPRLGVPSPSMASGPLSHCAI